MLKQIVNSQGYAVGWEEIPEAEAPKAKTSAPAAGTLHVGPAPKANAANKNRKG